MAALKLNAKQNQAFAAAFKRVAKLNLATATEAQKKAAALDVIAIFKLIQAAWPLIEAVLKALGLPIPEDQKDK